MLNIKFSLLPERKRLELQLFGETVENEPDVDETPNQEDQAEIEYDTIDYNKEEVKIPVTERKTYLQKGYNYDKIFESNTQLQQEVEKLRGSKEITYMKSFLEQNGYSSMDEYEQDLASDKIMEEGFTKEQAIEVMKGREAKAQEAKAQEENLSKQVKEEKQNAMIKDFVANFPEADLEKLSDEVVEMYNKGIDLSLAYELDQLRSGNNRTKIEQDTLKRLQDNKAISSGSAVGGNSNHKTGYKNMAANDFEKLKATVLSRG